MRAPPDEDLAGGGRTIESRHLIQALSAALALGALVVCSTAHSQDMEPRSYANTPINLNMAGLGYVHSWGAVLVDPSLPVEDLDVDIDTLTPLYVRTLAIFDWASKLIVAWPHASVTGEGKPYGETVHGERVGWADPRVRLNVNFIGAPALTMREFATYQQKTIVGATFEVQAPLGSYDSDQFVNLGANRWTFAAESGISRRIRRWTLEGTAGAIVFTANDEFVGSSTLEQDPVVYADAHAIYSFNPAIWISLDFLWVWGGQSSLDGVERADLQSNSRGGLTFSMPIARRHSLKLTYTSGVTTRIGADFQSVGLSWVMNWGG